MDELSWLESPQRLFFSSLGGDLSSFWCLWSQTRLAPHRVSWLPRSDAGSGALVCPFPASLLEILHHTRLLGDPRTYQHSEPSGPPQLPPVGPGPCGCVGHPPSRQGCRQQPAKAMAGACGACGEGDPAWQEPPRCLSQSQSAISLCL